MPGMLYLVCLLTHTHTLSLSLAIYSLLTRHLYLTAFRTYPPPSLRSITLGHPRSLVALSRPGTPSSRFQANNTLRAQKKMDPTSWASA